MIDTIDLAAPAVPGLRFRHYRGEEDLAPMLDVWSAAREADEIDEVQTLEQMRLNYANLVNCDPARDITLVEVDGDEAAFRVGWRHGERLYAPHADRNRAPMRGEPFRLGEPDGGRGERFQRRRRAFEDR